MSNENQMTEANTAQVPALVVATGSPSQKIVGTGFYHFAKPGTFGRAEWLDLLMACQDGRATCFRVLELIEREQELQGPTPQGTSVKPKNQGEPHSAE